MSAESKEQNLEKLQQAALDYHEFPKPGKLAIVATKALTNQHDLALAYSPGVAVPCEEIEADPMSVYRYTNKGNLVAVISDGTAVLGLGNIGPLASKPVMEGKAVLFKNFADIDVFDLEIQRQEDLDKFVDIVAALEPTFGGINLEDIKAPDCFYIEEKLRERMNIPVFHDDQHGTAIVVSAATTNALKIVGKKIEDVKLVASGAGAAAISCLNLLISLGLRRENIYVIDGSGLIYEGRAERMTSVKAAFAQKTSMRTLAEAMVDADVFLGLSAGNVVNGEMVKTMAAKPIILALANPTPEVAPEVVHAVRDDAIVATGRSDYPNQVNNVLCFPYIFRGALDCGATTINNEMQIAVVNAIAELAQAEQDEVVANAYAGEVLQFGPEYLIPKPFDTRLMMKIAPAVAKAAQDSGVASRPINDLEQYRSKLESIVYASGSLMKPIFEVAKKAAKKRIVYAEGANQRILRAVQIVVDEKLAAPILVGNPAAINDSIKQCGLRLREGVDYEVFHAETDPRFGQFCQRYHQLADRKGVTPKTARIEMLRSATLCASLLLEQGYADGMICGSWGSTGDHLRYVDQVIGRKDGANSLATMSGSVISDNLVFIADTYVNYDPSAEQLAEITIMAAEEMQKLGVSPRIALLSHSCFGSSDKPSAVKMRAATALVKQLAPELEVDGELHGDLAFDPEGRKQILPNCTLKGVANLLITPNVDASNIAQNLLRATASNNVTIGPILLGSKLPVQILTPSATVRRTVNMTAITVARANTGN